MNEQPDGERRASPCTLQILRLLAREPERWREATELSDETGIPLGTAQSIFLRLGRQGYLQGQWFNDEVGQGRPRYRHRLNVQGLSYAARKLL